MSICSNPTRKAFVTLAFLGLLPAIWLLPSCPGGQALAAIPARQAATHGGQEIVFIDPAVSDYRQIIPGIPPDAEVVVLDAARDGVAQITKALARRTGVDALHIISHGGSASLRLGAAVLAAGNLDNYATQFQAWSDALSPGADLLLYGCEVAAGRGGAGFVQRLAQLTGADVAASDDLTGNMDKGGDWVLEYRSGKIETVAYTAPGFRGLLVAGPTVTTAISDQFNDTNLDNWVETTTAGSTQTMNGTQLELTPAQNSKFGAMLFNTEVQSSSAMTIEFRYYMGGGTGADGLAFFLVDGTTTSFNVGDAGPGLGYADSHSFGSTNGLDGGWLGVGLDSWGNYANTSWMPDGPVSVTTPYIGVRGSESKTTLYNGSPFGYQWIAGLPETSMGGNSIDGGFRRVKVTLGSSATNTLMVQWDWNDDGTYDYTPINIDLDNFSTKVATRPSTLKFGFSAGTGGANNKHAIDWFTLDTGSTTGTDLNYTEGDGAVALNDASLSVASGVNLTGASVAISSNYVTGQDELLFTNQNGITGSFSAGTLTLSGTTTAANYQTALRSVQYRNASNLPNTTQRGVVITTTDGTTTSADFTMNINVTALNDAPVAVNDTAVTATNTIVTTVNVLANDTDINGDTLSVSAFDANSVQGGTVVNNGNGTFTYTPPVNFTGADSFTYTVSDGNGGTDIGTMNVTVSTPASPPPLPLLATVGVNGLFFSPGNPLILSGAVTPGPLTGTVVDGYITITLPAGDTFYLQPDGTWALTIAPVVTNWPMAPVSGTILNYTFQGTEPPGVYVLRIFFRQPGTTIPVGREARGFFIFMP